MSGAGIAGREELLAEIDLTMSLSGASSWDEVDRSLLA